MEKHEIWVCLKFLNLTWCQVSFWSTNHDGEFSRILGFSVLRQTHMTNLRSSLPWLPKCLLAAPHQHQILIQPTQRICHSATELRGVLSQSRCSLGWSLNSCKKFLELCNTLQWLQQPPVEAMFFLANRWLIQTLDANTANNDQVHHFIAGYNNMTTIKHIIHVKKHFQVHHCFKHIICLFKIMAANDNRTVLDINL